MQCNTEERKRKREKENTLQNISYLHSQLQQHHFSHSRCAFTNCFQHKIEFVVLVFALGFGIRLNRKWFKLAWKTQDDPFGKTNRNVAKKKIETTTPKATQDCSSLKQKQSQKKGEKNVHAFDSIEWTIRNMYDTNLNWYSTAKATKVVRKWVRIINVAVAVSNVKQQIITITITRYYNVP